LETCLTGGTGFVGREILRQLNAAGHGVRLLVRSPTRLPPKSPAGLLRVVPVDFASAGELVRAMAGCQAVLHLVGIISECGDQTFERVHTGLTRVLVAAAREAGVARFLHMSALGTRPEAPSRYHRTKWEAEQIVRESPLAWTVFRPSLIYGREDAFTRLLLRMASWSPVLPVIGGGHSRVQPISVTEVARAFVGAVDRGETAGQTFDLCGPERLRLVDLFRLVMAGAGRRRLLVPVPWGLAWYQARFLEAVWPRLFRRPPPLNRAQVLMLREDNVGDGGAADRAFGLQHPPLGPALRLQLHPSS